MRAGRSCQYSHSLVQYWRIGRGKSCPNPTECDSVALGKSCGLKGQRTFGLTSGLLWATDSSRRASLNLLYLVLHVLFHTTYCAHRCPAGQKTSNQQVAGSSPARGTKDLNLPKSTLKGWILVFWAIGRSSENFKEKPLQRY